MVAAGVVGRTSQHIGDTGDQKAAQQQGRCLGISKRRAVMGAGFKSKGRSQLSYNHGLRAEGTLAVQLGCRHRFTVIH